MCTNNSCVEHAAPFIVCSRDVQPYGHQLSAMIRLQELVGRVSGPSIIRERLGVRRSRGSHQESGTCQRLILKSHAADVMPYHRMFSPSWQGRSGSLCPRGSTWINKETESKAFCMAGSLKEWVIRRATD